MRTPFIYSLLRRLTIKYTYKLHDNPFIIKKYEVPTNVTGNKLISIISPSPVPKECDKRYRVRVRRRW